MAQCCKVHTAIEELSEVFLRHTLEMTEEERYELYAKVGTVCDAVATERTEVTAIKESWDADND